MRDPPSSNWTQTISNYLRLYSHCKFDTTTASSVGAKESVPSCLSIFDPVGRAKCDVSKRCEEECGWGMAMRRYVTVP